MRRTIQRSLSFHLDLLQKELTELETATNRLYEAVEKGLLPMDQTLTERAQKHKARREAVMIEMAQAQRQEEMPVSMLTAHRSKPSALRYVLG